MDFNMKSIKLTPPSTHSNGLIGTEATSSNEIGAEGEVFLNLI